MASPRRRRLRKMLRAGLLRAQEVVEAVAEKVAPEEDAPVAEESSLVVEEPVIKEVKKEKAAPKVAKKPAKKAN